MDHAAETAPTGGGLPHYRRRHGHGGPELRVTLEIRLAEAGVETAGFYELMV